MVSKSKPSIAVIIPAYNEEKVIGLCIDKVIETISQSAINIKLVVINDGSKDRTEQIINEKFKKYKKNLVILIHKRNKGYGAATQTGIDWALKYKYDWCLHMDSDLTNDPKYILKFSRFVDKEYDCIKASRYIKNSKIKNVPFFRIAVSAIGNFMAFLLFRIGIKDCTNGFRMVRTEKLRGIKFKENNFSIILEELYYLKKSKSKFAEIPYVLTARTNSKSHFNYKPRVFWDYIKYAIKSFLIW